jgi:glycosyltransferase involved in cell wall biosynthesis
MRILLTANASYVPPRGGATRSNLIWMDHLAGAGHACRIVCATLAANAGRREQMRQEQIETAEVQPEKGVEVARRGAIEVWSVEDPAHRLQVLRRQIAEFQPDWVLVSSEDLGHGLLREAHQNAPGRVVYLAHTPQFFPFGPASWNPEPKAAELVRHCAGIVAIGQVMAQYIEASVGRPAAVIHPPIYGSGPFADHSQFDRGVVTMINPCAVKGISIFLELASRFPDVAFAALPGWGTTAEDRRGLAARPNIQILPNCKDIDEVLAHTRILLMPSIWYEGFGLIVMEAMLRRLPVIASASGGLREAKEGTGYVLPVAELERFEAVFDEYGMPRPVVGTTDIEPWRAALEELLTDAGAYARESARSWERAKNFVASLDAGQMEAFLRDLRPAETRTAGARPVESLSPAQRAWLLARARQRKPDTR